MPADTLRKAFPSAAVRVRAAFGVFALALAVFAIGCSKPSPKFVLNTEGREPGSVKPEQAEAIGQKLEKLFGTPDEPKVPPEARLDLSLLNVAAGPVGGDAQGNQVGLFRRHCVACHGISGDGAGPTAISVSPPYPRDFRNGVVKFTSTRAGKPLRSDLRRTLLRGIPGTAMPSFAQLQTQETEALIEYVKYLGIRGETELYLMRAVVDDDDPIALETQYVLSDAVEPAAAAWTQPEQNPNAWVIEPPAPPPVSDPVDLADSIARGRALYLTKETQCAQCHGDQGDGKGENTELFDDWNKPKNGVTPEQTAELAKRFTLPIEKLRPRDFRQNIFHGGANPEDLYVRIAGGIKGTPMPGLLGAPGSPDVVSPADVWHIVNFVRALANGTDENELRRAGKQGVTSFD